jgi:hypothetical protein
MESLSSDSKMRCLVRNCKAGSAGGVSYWRDDGDPMIRGDVLRSLHDRRRVSGVNKCSLFLYLSWSCGIGGRRSEGVMKLTLWGVY